MLDRSFLQALHDLQERISGHVQEATYRMLLQHATATNATLDIQDENMRTIVTNELITGQIIAALALMRDMGFLDEAHYSEFRTYLRHALASQYIYMTTGWSDPFPPDHI